MVALLRLADLYYNEGQIGEAEKYFQLAADQGNVQAQFKFALLKYNKRDNKLAKKYYQFAADQGNKLALSNLIKICISEDSEDRITSNEKYFKMAADLGNVDAQLRYGILLRKNPASLTLANEYLQKAYRQGDGYAWALLDNFKDH